MSTWSGKGWEVRLGRWQDSPPDGVDVVLTDPPYDERTHAGARTLWRTGERWRDEDGKQKPREIPINFEHLTDYAFVPELISRARRWTIAFCTLEQLGVYEAAAGDAWIRAGVWHRTDGTPQLSGDRPAQAAEGIAIMHGPGRKRWNGGGRRGLWSYGVERDDRQHPTQKPLDLMLELVRLFTEPGELVWDPFGGSMTTGVACLMLGRRFVGHEMQQNYAATGAERLRAAEQGLTLSAARAGQISLFAGAK